MNERRNVRDQPSPLSSAKGLLRGIVSIRVARSHEKTRARRTVNGAIAPANHSRYSRHKPMNARTIVVAIGLFLNFSAPAAEEPHYDTLPLGSAAPDFSLPGVDGKSYSLKDFADAKVLAIIFTCNHCPTAQNYEERIKALVTEFRPRGVAYTTPSRIKRGEPSRWMAVAMRTILRAGTRSDK